MYAIEFLNVYISENILKNHQAYIYMYQEKWKMKLNWYLSIAQTWFALNFSGLMDPFLKLPFGDITIAVVIHMDRFRENNHQ